MEANPEIKFVELSNWGEFCSIRMVEILEYAYRKRIQVALANGVNLNTAKPVVLEALVCFKVRLITCSIDGASQETYQVYRVGGDFDQVIRNVEQINEFKNVYRSKYPRLTWQFVAFEHNIHEIQRARDLAARLGIRFWVKLNWDDFFGMPFSPVTNGYSQVAAETGFGVGNRAEYERKFGKAYGRDSFCGMMWTAPQLTFDGRVLGCCVNYWGDYGNALSDGFAQVLNGERMQYARRMLKGELPERDDIPCSNCKIYRGMKATSNWIRLAD
jgi:sulfatase maturation enzyme AslB (radical SAM superfamily)